MTIPNLLSRYQEQTTVNRLLKAYSILEQAFTTAISENGTVDTWCSQEDLWDACSLKIYETVKPHLKVLKECDKNAASGCFNRLYKHRFNDVVQGVNQKSLILSDGISIAFWASSGGNNKTQWCKAGKTSKNSYNYCGTISVDIDGQKGRNTIDLDLFNFHIYKDGIAPSAMPREAIWTSTFDGQCLGNHYYAGFGCTAWIIINKNMDYLHCPEKLGWEKARSCKE